MIKLLRNLFPLRNNHLNPSERERIQDSIINGLEELVRIYRTEIKRLEGINTALEGIKICHEELLKEVKAENEQLKAELNNLRG